MSNENSILDEGLERLREAMGSLEDEIERVQGEFRVRQRSFEKRAEKLRAEILESDAVKQLEELRERATRQVEQSWESSFPRCRSPPRTTCGGSIADSSS